MGKRKKNGLSTTQRDLPWGRGEIVALTIPLIALGIVTIFDLWLQLQLMLEESGSIVATICSTCWSVMWRGSVYLLFPLVLLYYALGTVTVTVRRRIHQSKVGREVKRRRKQGDISGADRLEQRLQGGQPWHQFCLDEEVRCAGKCGQTRLDKVVDVIQAKLRQVLLSKRGAKVTYSSRYSILDDDTWTYDIQYHKTFQPIFDTLVKACNDPNIVKEHFNHCITASYLSDKETDYDLNPVGNLQFCKRGSKVPAPPCHLSNARDAFLNALVAEGFNTKTGTRGILPQLVELLSHPGKSDPSCDAKFRIAFHGVPSIRAARCIARHGFNPQLRDRQSSGPGEYFDDDMTSAIAMCPGEEGVIIVALLLEPVQSPDVTLSVVGKLKDEFRVQNSVTRNETYCLPLMMIPKSKEMHAKLFE